MKFVLLDKNGSEQVHEGSIVRLKSPQSISWGMRVFVRTTEGEKGAIYREVDNFRIGK